MIKYDVKLLLIMLEDIKSDSDNNKYHQFLINNKFFELAAFVSALKNDDDALEWLAKFKYYELLAIHDAIFDNYDAFLWLKQNSHPAIIAMILLIRNDTEAANWLKKNAEILYMIGNAIKNLIENIEKEKSKFSNFWKDLHRFN